MTRRFNPAPGWPKPPPGWSPPADWKPDPSWPPAPPDWEIWVEDAPLDNGQASAQIHTTDDNLPLPTAETITPDESGEQGDGDSAVSTSEVAALRRRIAELEARLSTSSGSDTDDNFLRETGLYQYNHPLENADAYKARLAEIKDEIRGMVKAGNAVLATDTFALNNSLAQGQAMVRDLSRLMLRAYNAEADNCARALRSGNASKAKRRLDDAAESIERLGRRMDMRINPAYHELRLAELELVADFQMKRLEERELERERREELREQRRVEQELATERERLEKERRHYETVLASLPEDDPARIEMTDRLGAIDESIAANDYRAANIRAGYVYVISNVGAFGRSIVKIGMTRRLEPHDRVRELGDASVPFVYDTHALFFSDDAISLEAELHRLFADRRVNHANPRREFFFATPSEVREALAEKVGGLLQFDEEPEAIEYYQSLKYWPDDVRNSNE